PRITEGQATQTVITHNVAYQADDLNAYDSDYDELNTAKVALIANLSHYGSNALAKVNNHDNVDNNLMNQVVQVMPSSNQSSVTNNSETKITSDSNIIPYSHVNDTLSAELERYKEQVKVLKEGQNVDLKSKDNISDSCEQSVEIDHQSATESSSPLTMHTMEVTSFLVVIFAVTSLAKGRKVIGRGIRKKGLYVMKLGNKPKDQICLTTIDENSTLWHRRLGHANMRLIQSLASKELVRNLPKLKFDQHFCDACKMGKQAHASHKAKNVVSTTRCLEILHMDLFGPSAVRSYGGNRYTLVIVDDYSRYTWTRFLKDKTEAFDQFEIFSRKIQNQLGCSIVSIRTDHGREFDNEVQFGEFCNANGITHNFSAPRTPQSNGVVERKNRTLQEMSRTMLNEQSLPQKFWCNAVDTSTYILNRFLIRSIPGKTPYELLKGRKPTLDYSE
ncbi:retrovirus-related pol polyprotein from transposon TNT 1-94, partial [Tanacetum coccineum]